MAIAENGVIRAFGDFPPETIISVEYLAQLLGRCATSIIRSIDRNELPQTVKLCGDNVWTVRCLVAHFEKRLADAEAERQKLIRKLGEAKP